MALDSDQIMKSEESLGILLKNLTSFHGNLSYDPSEITLEGIWNLEENIKQAIE